MNTIKRIVAAATFGMVSFLGLQAATVSVTETKTHYPWNGKVDVTYAVAGVETGSQYALSAKVFAGTGEYDALSTNITENGTYSFTWDATAAGFTGRVEDAKVVFTTHEPNFAIVDLSAGAEATSYPVSYRAEVKDPTNDIYKTTKLLLKRLGGNYVGVFEVTQKQYELVMGVLPDAKRPYFSLGDAEVAAKRPVERVSYELLTENGGFFDLLKDRTDLPFALPTGEEWEAAARGDMPANKDFNIGSNNYKVLTGKATDNIWLPKMGRYIDLWENGVKAINGNNNPNRYSDETKGTAVVGSYNANDNGLYDIHGNVAEWTSEKNGQGSYVLRGGSWQSSAADCAVGAKWAYSGADANQLYKCGFRVFGDAVKIEEGFVHETTVTSEVFAVDVAFDPAGDNRRYLTVEDKATEDHKKAYAFTYWTNNVEKVAREREGGSRPWVAFDEGNAKWRPTTCGKNVATYTDGDGAEWKATFLVKPLPFEEAKGTVVGLEKVTYDGAPHCRHVVIEKPLVNYEIKYGESKDDINYDVPSYTDAGVYTVWYRITSLEPGAFYKAVTNSFTLTIEPRSVEGAKITNVDHKMRFTGLMQTQEVASVELTDVPVLDEYGETKTLTSLQLVQTNDYFVTHNTGIDAAGYFLVVNGQGNYKDVWTNAWEICPIDLRKNAGEGGGTGGDEYTPADDVQINLASDGHPFVYNGHEQTNYILSVSIGTQKFYPGSASFAEFDTSVSHATEVGKYTVYIYGTGNFQGTIKKDWTISPMSITNATVYLDAPFDYTGDTQTRNVTNITVATDAYSVERAPFAPTVDVPSYTIDVPLTSVNIAGKQGREASAKVGKYTIRIRAKDTADNNFCDFTTKDWYIGQRDITNAVFTIVDETYGRGPKMPNATAKDRDSETVPTITPTTNVVEGVTNDWFIAEYIDNVEVASDSKIVFKGTENGNYRGVLTNDFVIAPAVISKVAVKDAWKQIVWDGKPKTITAGRVTVTTESGLTLKTDPQEYKTSGQRQATDSGKYTVTVEPLSSNFTNSVPPAFDTWTIVPAAPVLTWPTFYGATNVTGEAGTVVYGVSDLTVAAVARCPGETLHIEFAGTNKVIDVRDNKFHVTEKTKITVYATFTAADGTVLEGAKTVVTLVPGQCADPKVYFKPGTAGRVSDDEFDRNSTVVTIEPSNTVNGVKVQDPSSGTYWPAWDQTKGKIYYSLLDENEQVITNDVDYAASGLKVSADAVYVVAQIRDTENKQYLDSIIVTQMLTRVIGDVETPVITVTTNSVGWRTVEIACATPDAMVYFTTNYAHLAAAEALRPAGPMEIAQPESNRTATVKYEGPFLVWLDKDVSVDIKAIAYTNTPAGVETDFSGRSAVANKKDFREWTIGDALDCPDQVFSNGWSQVLVPQVSNPKPGVESDWGHTDKPWMVVREGEVAESAVGKECMRSGVLTNGNLRTSSLTTEVVGPGMVVFNWRANCEDDPTGETWDHGEFIINGVITQKIDGVTGWQTVTNMIANTGTNVLTWTYVKDFVKHGEGIAESNDCIYVDNFRFVKAPEFANVSITVDPLVFNYALQLPTNEVLASTGKTTNYIHVVLTNPQTGASYELQEGKDFTVAATAKRAAKTYTGNDALKLEATEKSVYITGSTNVSWTILPLDLTNGVVTLDQTSFTYDGAAKKVNVTKLEGRHYRDGLVNVYDVKQGWTPKSDTQTEANTYTLTVTGSQNLTNSVSTTWTIAAKQLTPDMVTLKPTTFYYNREGQTPKVAVKAKSPEEISADDYTVSFLNKADYSTDITNAGTKVAIVTAKDGSNWSGAVTNEYSIWKAVVDTLTLSEPKTPTYTGKELSVTGTVKMAKNSRPKLEIFPTECKIINNVGTNAGTYTASVELVDTNNFKIVGSAPTAAWKILPIDMSTATLTLVPATYTFEYDGTEKKVVKRDVTSVTVNGLTPTGFDVSCEPKTNVNNSTTPYTFKVTSIDPNFAGTNNYPWSITPRSLTNAVITLTTNLVWNGVTVITNEGTKLVRHVITNATEQTMTFTVRDENIAKDLVLGVDYAIDNVNTNTGIDARRYMLQINGLGNYSAAASNEWVIAPSLVTITPNVRNPGTNDILYAQKGDRVAMEVDDPDWGKPYLRRTTYNDDGTVKKQSNWNLFRSFAVQERTLVEAFAVTPDCVTGAVRSVDYRFGFDATPVVCFADTNNVPCLYEDGTPWTNGVGHVISNFCHNGQLIALTRGNVVVSNFVDGTRQAYTNDAENAIYTDGVLRYTLDGSDPTADSPAWTAGSRIAITNTTTVIAKVFGGQYVDSPAVTNLFIRDMESYGVPVVKYRKDVESAWAEAFDGDTVDFDKVGLEVKLENTNAYGTVRYSLDGGKTVYTNVCTFTLNNSTNLTTWVADDEGEYTQSATVSVCFDRDQVLAMPLVTFDTNTAALVVFQDGTTFTNTHQYVWIGREDKVGTKYTDGHIVYTTNDWATSAIYAGAFEIWDTTTVKAKATGGVYGYKESETNVVTFTKDMKALDDLAIKIEKTPTVKQVKVTITNNTGNIVYYTVDGSDPIGVDRTAAKHGSTFSGEGTSFVEDVDVGETLVVKAIAYAEVSGGQDYVAVSKLASNDFTRVWTIGDSIKPDDPAKQAKADQPDASDMTFVNDTTTYDKTNTAWVVDTDVYVATNAQGVGSSMRSGAARAGDPGDPTTASVLTTTVRGPGALTFQWKSSTEFDEFDPSAMWDYGTFYVDGNAVTNIWGTNDWKAVSYTIAETNEVAQEHTLEWVYSKDWSDDDVQVEELGIQDCIWVDEFVWTCVPDMKQCDVYVGELTYNQQSQTPSIVVTNRETKAELVKGTDYEIDITPQTNASNDYTFVVKGLGTTYTGSNVVTWAINPLSITNAVVTLSGGQMYDRKNGNNPVMQYAVVEHIAVGAFELVNDTTWSLASGVTNATDAGTYAITLKGSDNLTGTVSTNWVIAPRPITSDMIKIESKGKKQIVYSGIGTNVSFVLKYENSTQGLKADDYTVVPGSNIGTNAGNYKLCIDMIEGEGKNFTGSATQDWSIAKFDFDQYEGVPELTVTNFFYTGLPQTTDVAKVIAQHPYFGEIAFSNEAWVVSNNVATAAGEHWAMLYPTEGNLAGGPISNKWTISQADIGDVVVVLGPTNTYNGTVQKQTIVSVTHSTIGVLSPNDYTVKNNSKKVAGKFEMTLTGKGNWTGEKKVPWEQLPALIDSVTFDPASYVYDGTVKTPAITVMASNLVAAVGTDFTTNFPSSVSSATLAGTNTVTVKGSYDPTKTGATGNFKVPSKDLTTNVTWVIEKRDISTLTVTQDKDTFVYDRTAQTNEVTVTLAENGHVFTNGVDYIVERVGDCVNVGTVTNRIIGIGSVFGTNELTYTITPATIDKFQLTQPGRKIQKEYNGEIQTVTAFLVKAGDLTLDTTEYKLSNAAKKDVGEYTSVVSALSKNFADPTTTLSGTWWIVPRDITGSEVLVVLKKPIVYTGKEQKIEQDNVEKIAVKSGTLKVDGCKIDCPKHTDAGTYNDASVTATDPNFKGSAAVEWTIEQRDITDATIVWDSDRLLWNGAEQTPTVKTITVGGPDLEAGKTLDFEGSLATLTVNDGDKVEAGRYASTVSGTKNFKGTTTNSQTWEIVPKSPAITPNDGTGKYTKIADWITVKISNDPDTQEWSIFYTTNDWAETLPYKLDESKFDITNHTVVAAYAVSVGGAVTSAISRCEYFFGNQNVAPTVALTAAEGAEKGRPQTWDNTEIKGVAKLIVTENGAVYTNFYHSGTKVSLTRFGAMTAEEIEEAKKSTTYGGNCPYTDGEVWYTVDLVGDGIAPTNYDDGVSKLFNPADATTWQTIDTNAVIVARTFGNQLESSAEVTNVFQRLWTQMPKPDMSANEGASFQFTNVITLATNLYDGADWTVTNENQKLYYTLDGSVPTKDSKLYEGPFTLTWKDCDANGKVSVQAISYYGDDYLVSDVVSNEYTHVTTQFTMPTMTPSATFKHKTPGQLVAITNNAPLEVGGVLKYSTNGVDWVVCSGGDVANYVFWVHETTTVMACVFADNAHDYTTSATNSATYTYVPYQYNTPTISPASQVFDTQKIAVTVTRPAAPTGDDPAHVGVLRYKRDAGNWIDVDGDSASFDIDDTTTVVAEVYDPSGDHVTSAQVTNTYTRTLKAVPQMWLEDLEGNKLIEEGTADVPATNYWHKSRLKITGVSVGDAEVYYSIDRGTPVECTAGTAFQVSNTFEVIAWAAVASKGLTGPAVTNVYTRHWETLVEPEIDLLNPEGAVTNVFRHSGDTVYVTNGTVQAGHDAVAWTNQTVKIAVIPGVTNGVPAAADWFAYEEGTTIFTNNTNTVWAVVEADDYLPSTNTVWFVREIDALGAPTINLSNEKSRTNVVVTFTMPEGANTIWYTYAVTNDDETVELVDPIGEEYDATSAAHLASTVWTNGSEKVNIAIKPHQQVVVKAIAYSEDDDLELPCTTRCFTGKSAVTNAAISLDWTIADGLDVPDWKTFTVTSSQREGSTAEVVEDDEVKNFGDSSIHFQGVANSQWLAVSTTVTGPGTVVFDWKTLCEKGPHGYNYDHMTFYVNGTPICKLDGDSGWQTVSNRINGAIGTKNVLKWVYEKDASEHGALGDEAWLDHFRWTAEATQLEITEDLEFWAEEYLYPDEYAALYNPDGSPNLAKWQEMLGWASEQGRTYWECYVLGLDPEDYESELVITSPTINEYSGAVSVTFNPRVAGRTYTLVGKKSLTDVYWTDLKVMAADSASSEPTTITSRAGVVGDGYKFFQLRVKMTQPAE